MKKILITGLLCFVVIISKAQNESKDSSIDMGSKKNHYIGFNAGASTGLGLAYRYQNNKHSYQFALLPIMSERNAFVNIGGRYAYNFKEVNKTRFFGYIGHSAGTSFYEYDDYAIRLVTGAGFGIEQDLTKNLSLNFGAGYAYYYYNFDDSKLTLTAELGLFYKFN